MSIKTLHASLTIDAVPVDVVSCRLIEGLSRVSHAVLEIASPSDVNVAARIGETAVLTLEMSGAPIRTIRLLVGRGGFARVQQGSLRYHVELFSRLWTLQHTRNLRKFRNLSAKDIVAQVLSEHGLAHDWQLLRDPPKRKYCVQYRESQFEFVSRLLEFEGIFYVQNDDGSLLLTDRSVNLPLVDGETHFRLLEHEDALQGEMGLRRVARGARVASGKVTVNDYNWKTPRVSLLSSSDAGQDSELEIYDYPSGFRKPDDGAALSERLLEAHRARTRFLSGKGNVASFHPGRRFHFDGRFADEYLILGVEHWVRNTSFDTAETADETAAAGAGHIAYENAFEAIPASVPFRAMPTTAHPTVQGCHSAMVRGPLGEEIHTDPHGRFRAQFHWDREAVGTDEDSRWLRKLQESGTGANLARIGWEVSVAYIDGDPDRPIGLARNINGVMRPSYAQPGEKQLMTIKTPTYPSSGGYNELRLDDRAEAMMIEVRAERDLRNKVQNNKTEAIGNDETHVVDLDFSHTVKRDQTQSIGANRTTTVGGEHRVDVLLSRTETIAGNEELETPSSVSWNVGGSQTKSIGSLRLSIVGTIAAPDVAGNAKALVAGVKNFTGSTGEVVRAVGQGALAGSGLGGALGGALGGGGVTGALSGALSGGGGIAGALGGGALTGGGGIGGALSGALSGAVGGLKSAIPNPAAAIPSPAQALNSVTGGLSSGNVMALFTGNIGRSAEKSLSRTVGGAMVALTANSITAGSGFAMVETVGGAKVTMCGGAHNQTVGGPMAFSVGGAVFRKSGEDMGVGSKTSTVNVGGLVKLRSDELLEINGATVTLEARASFKLEAGGMSIEMTPDTIRFKGPLLLQADDSVSFAAGQDNITKEGEAAE